MVQYGTSLKLYSITLIKEIFKLYKMATNMFKIAYYFLNF